MAITQMEKVNVATCRGKYASMDVVGSDSNITRLYAFKRVTWCSTSRDSLTRSIPGDWSCPCP
jgi:ABC-type phosphate/phosphonate transport system substrate-binding protein